MYHDFRISIATTVEQDADLLRDRIVEKICKLLKEGQYGAVNKVELVTNAFYDKDEANKYLYSDQSTEYTRLLDLVFLPLKEQGLIDEFENNTINFTDRFKRLCKRALQSNNSIDWHNIDLTGI